MNISTLLWLIKIFKRKPSIRGFKLLIIFLFYEIKSLLSTGLTLEEIYE